MPTLDVTSAIRTSAVLTDYFDRESWIPRIEDQHRKECRKIRLKETKSKQQWKESKYSMLGIVHC